MPLEIPVEEQSTIFKAHLEAEYNDRIIFSGAFGIGKTYFLDKFFDKKNSDYLAIKLTPINYCISSNEDIFKLIKYDILFELGLVYGLEFESEPVSRSIAYGTLVPDKIAAIIETLTPLLVLLDKPLSAVSVALGALYGILNITKEIESQRIATGEATEVVELGVQVNQAYVHETDYATEYIETTLKRLAEKKGAQYKVLIIDDLDRIDPEHIFRLFNIFSAHFDYNRTLRNKFGFDKVVFVCDVNNVRSIFHARYGTGTDFTGYIDKFFSQEIFFFSNEKQVKEAVSSFINEICPVDESSKVYFNQNIKQGRNYNEKGLLQIILPELILSGGLTMRRFQNSYRMSFSVSTRSLEIPGSYSKKISFQSIPVIIVIELISRIMGGGPALAKALVVACKSQRTNDFYEVTANNISWLIGSILPVVDYKNHRFDTSTLNVLREYRGIEGQPIDYILTQSGGRQELYLGNASTDTRYINFFTLLSQTVDVLLQEGVLK